MLIQVETTTASRAEVAAAVDKLNAVLNAHDLGDTDAFKVFAESKPAEFAVVRAAEVAKKLADLDKPKDIVGAIEAVLGD